MCKEIQLDNTTLIVDVMATQNYRTEYNKMCGCAMCLNYHKAVKTCSSLIIFLDEFGIDTDRPDEVVSCGDDAASQTVEYNAWHSVCGEIIGANVFYELDGAKIEIAAPTTYDDWPVTDHADTFFWVVITLKLPWVLSERMSEVFKKPISQNTFMQRIKALLLRYT